MKIQRKSNRRSAGDAAVPVQRSPGKSPRTRRLNQSSTKPVQKKGGASDEASVHEAAGRGTQSASSSLPHIAAIQKSFGRHDVSGIQSHVGDEATKAAGAMNAEAYATGDHVVFGGAPSLHTAAHEAAHVVQQRAGVSLKGGVGQEGDAYEQHADQVPDLVVRGESSEGLLDQMAGPRSSGSAGAGGEVQRKSTKGVEVSKSRTDALNADPRYQRDVEISQREVNGRQTNSAKRAEARVEEAKKEAFKKEEKGVVKFDKPGLVNEVRTDLIKKQEIAKVGEHKEEGEFLGGKAAAEGAVHLGSIEGQYGHNVTVNEDGASGSLFAEGHASLVSFKEELKWETGPFDFFGESMNGKLFLLVIGWVSANAAVQLNARLKKYQPEAGKPSVNPDAITSGIDLGAGAGAEAFAGAKLVVIPGAAWEWNKKEDKAYQNKLGQSADMLVESIGMANPALGWILHQMGADVAAEKVLGLLFRDGAAKTVPVVALQALGVGSAGVGGSLTASIGFQDGKLEWTMGASASLGLGIGGLIRVMLDPVEGIKFGLVTGGEMAPKAIEFARERVGQAVSGGVDLAATLGRAVLGWLGADNKAREAVANGAHELLAPEQRGELIDTMRRGVCGSADEAAILEILEFSQQKGDASEVLAHLGGPARASSDLLWSFHGKNDARLRQLFDQMGVAYA